MTPYVEAMKEQVSKLISKKEDFQKFAKKVGYQDEDLAQLAQELTEGKRSIVDKISFRGALSFWDAFPACNKMAVEILTPHYSHYYQSGDSPHDSGQPIPNSFLVVPQGCALNLIIECDKTRLPDESLNWQKLCTRIIEFASKWQGLGSKTAVGYGAFGFDDKLIEKREADKKEAEEKAAEEARLNSMTETMRQIEVFSKALQDEMTARPSYVVNESKINAELKGFYAVCETLTIPAEKDAAIEVLNKLFDYVKVNSKKKKEVRAEIDKLSQ
jgi:CRISPR-associated protein Cmr6